MREKKADCKLPTPPVREKWADTFRLMTDRDNRTARQIAQVIRFVTQDEFWSPNVRSASKLREKFDALELAMQRDAKPRGGAHAQTRTVPPSSKKLEKQRKLEAYLEQMHAEAEDKPKHVPDLDAYIAAKKAADSDGQDKAGTGKDNSNNEQPGAAQAADTNKEATG